MVVLEGERFSYLLVKIPTRLGKVGNGRSSRSPDKVGSGTRTFLDREECYARRNIAPLKAASVRNHDRSCFLKSSAVDSARREARCQGSGFTRFAYLRRLRFGAESSRVDVRRAAASRFAIRADAVDPVALAPPPPRLRSDELTPRQKKKTSAPSEPTFQKSLVIF